MDHDDLVIAFMEEHGHSPDAQELHDFVNLMIGRGNPASREQEDEVFAEIERAQVFERLADEDPDVLQLLAEMQRQNPGRSRSDLLKDLDIVGRMVEQNPGLTRDKVLKMIEDAGF